MSKKAPHQVNTFSPSEAPKLNQTITQVYQTKVESLNFNQTSGVSQKSYQSMEHGEVNFSGNGSANTVKSFGFGEKQGQIIYATAHASHNRLLASVTDVTLSGLTITLGLISGTANLSDVTTGTIKVWYQVIGSSP